MKVISGGQTGTDRAALEAANAIGLDTGGFAPLGYWTTTGSDISLKDFGLIEFKRGYPPRTLENVKAGDVTLLVAENHNSSGERLTRKYLHKENKPYLEINTSFTIDNIQLAVDFLIKHQPQVLNVAGNSEQTCPGIQARSFKLLKEIFSRYQPKGVLEW